MSINREKALEEPVMAEAESDNSDWRYTAEFHSSSTNQGHIYKKLIWTVCFVVPWFLLVLLGLLDWVRYGECKASYYIRPDLTYSPVQDLIEYDLKIFTTGFPDDPSEYVAEPSPNVDELWRGLYPSLYQLIPKEQAARLVNETVIFPHDEERRYIIELDVFHQLHCLNMIRKATRPDYYVPVIPEGETEDPDIGHEHINHCINVIRQALMCYSDISVYTWQWDDEQQSLVNQVKNPHTCRNFEKIQEWATVNTVRKYLDGSYHELNDPLDPSTWIEGYKGE